MKNNKKTNDDIVDPIYYTRPASPSDCTGYVPVSPEEEYERNDLGEMMDVLPKPQPPENENAIEKKNAESEKH